MLKHYRNTFPVGLSDHETFGRMQERGIEIDARMDELRAVMDVEQEKITAANTAA
jgi:hypothetical protein